MFSQNLKKKQNSKFSTTWDRYIAKVAAGEVVPSLLSTAEAPQTHCQLHGAGRKTTDTELVAALIEAQEDDETAQEYMESAMKQAEMADRRASNLKHKNLQLIENVEKARQDSREAKARTRNSESLVPWLSEQLKVQKQLINDELSMALDEQSEKEKVSSCLLDLAQIDTNSVAFNAFNIVV
jgi:hypothetical protein